MNPLAVLAGADVGTVGALGSLNTVGRTIARAAQIHPKSCFFFFSRRGSSEIGWFNRTAFGVISP